MYHDNHFFPSIKQKQKIISRELFAKKHLTKHVKDPELKYQVH